MDFSVSKDRIQGETLIDATNSGLHSEISTILLTNMQDKSCNFLMHLLYFHINLKAHNLHPRSKERLGILKLTNPEAKIKNIHRPFPFTPPSPPLV